MRFLCRLCRRRHTPAPPLSDEELQRMHQSTQDGLEAARATDEEAHALADHHREVRDNNHFGEMFLRLLEGGRDV